VWPSNKQEMAGSASGFTSGGRFIVFGNADWKFIYNGRPRVPVLKRELADD